MKKTARVISVAMILLIALSLAACGKSAKNEEADAVVATDPIKVEDLYGTWKGVSGEISTVSFSKDGSYRDDAGDIYIAGTYTFNEADQTVTVYESEYGMVFTYSAVLSGNQLTLQIDGGLPRNFVK